MYKLYLVSNPQVLNFYEDIHSFTRQLVSLLKLPQRCINTSMVFFHKYFLFKKKFPDIFTKYLSCFTCFFLALKVCDFLMPLDHLIKTFLKLLFKIQNINPIQINEKIIQEAKERVFQIEFEILDLIGLDLNVDMPYSYLQKMSPYFKDFLKNEKLILCITSFLNDSFKLPLCIYYDPLLILLACVFLCEFYFDVKLLDYQGLKWFEIIEKDIDINVVKEISLKMKFFYDYFTENKNSHDFEFHNKQYLNKAILDLDFEKFEVEGNINKELEIKNENEKNKILDKTDFDNKTENNELVGDFKLKKCKHDDKEIEKSDKIYKYTLELNEEVKENENFNNKDKFYKKKKIKKKKIYKKCKKIKSNIEKNYFTHPNENKSTINSNHEKNEIKNNYFSNNSAVLQENNFFKEIKITNLSEWPNKGKLLENNA